MSLSSCLLLPCMLLRVMVNTASSSPIIFGTMFPPRSGLVLFVADLFHPVGGLAVETFLNGDVRHGRGCRGAVPMFLPRREPDHVTRPHFLDRPPPALDPAAACRHDQGLAQRVAVPCGASAGLERDTGPDHPCWIGCLEQGVNAYRAGKILGRSFAGRL